MNTEELGPAYGEFLDIARHGPFVPPTAAEWKGLVEAVRRGRPRVVSGDQVFLDRVVPVGSSFGARPTFTFGSTKASGNAR